MSPLTMGIGFSSRAAARVRAALGLIGIMMLVGFPLQHAHSSFSHFRVHEVLRSVVRHTSLERTPKSICADEIHKLRLNFIPLADVADASEPVINEPVFPIAPIKLFLTRLRLGSSPASSQDPLLD